MADEPKRLTPETIRFCPLCGGHLEPRPIPPAAKLEMVCAACAFIFYINQKVVAGTIPAENGRILLTRRAIEPARGKWTFPGGYVDWGETVDAAALRETYEETGLTVALHGLVGVYSYKDAPVVIVVYGARVTGGSLRLCHENDRLEWMAPGEIPWDDLAFPSTTSALKDFFAARPVGR